jgi:transcriptional regulator with GAF, ATPase, and Fis domain
MNAQDAVDSWDVKAFGQTLSREESAGRIFVVEGLTAGQMHRDAPELRARLNRCDMPLFVLDPTGSASGGASFVDILAAYVRLAELRGLLSQPARHLFEFVTSADDQTQSGLFPAAGGNLFSDTLCRLWSVLSRDMPAVLMVLNARHCPPSECKTLNHLTSFFFADPIEQLTPELESMNQGRGRLVYLREGAEFPVRLEGVPTVDVDLRGSAEESVRKFLADPQIIRRFVKSTGGDPQRLGELVESLPGDVRNFWLYRYERLKALERSLINILAVAGEPILVDALHDATALMQASEYFARSLRRLTEMGFLSRKISSGAVQIHIASPDFANSVVEKLAAENRRAIHKALADAVQSRADGDFADEFLARHYIAAGDGEAGLRHGRRAAKRLISRRAYERAQALLDSLLALAASDDDRREIHAQLIEAHVGLGNPRKALTHCASLADLVDEGVSTLRLQCQTGRLLNHIGEYERAAELFEEVAGAADGEAELRELWAEAQLGEGEALFSQGHHRSAESRAFTVIEQIQAAGENDSPTGAQAAMDMSLLKARNLAGKVAVLRGECPDARELFEQNRALAVDWGWDDEAARAEANLGLVALQQKNFSDALERLERAQTMARSPAAIRRAYALINLGIVHQRKGHYEEALRHYLEGLRASRQEGDDAGYAMAAYNLVTLYQDVGAFGRARSIIEHLQELQSRGEGTQFLGDLPTVVLGSLLLDERNYAEALQAFAGLIDSPHESTAASLPAREARLRSVEAHLALGQREVAERIVAEFAQSEDELPDNDASDGGLSDGGESQPQLVALYELARASLALDEGDADAALSRCRGAAELARSAGHGRDALRISGVLARALLETQRPQEARSLLERELQQLRQKARAVPEAHRDDFFSVPVHQELVELLRQLKGEIPEEFEANAAVDKSAEAPASATNSGNSQANVDDPAFRRWRSRYKKIVGESPRLHHLFHVLDRVAASDSPVLLLGESGTGKELMAEAVHTESARADAPFIKVNCAGFVEDLLLSELFGHVKGAFTGAVAEKVGRFELADGGTIFLDEVGDISAKTQVALLRVLQEGSFEKVGATRTQQVDVRLVCATNKNLEEMVQRGEFRLDLYYRLKGVVMEMPPLRERRADIARLVLHFGREYARGQKPKKFSTEVMRFLAAYSWPGNIRELQNFVRSILLFVEGDTVEMSHVHDFGEFFAGGDVDLELPEVDFALQLDDYEDVGEVYEDPEQALVEQIIAEGLSLANIKTRLEFESIRRALIETGGNITRAAEMLQMKRPRLSQIVNSTAELLTLKNELVG